MYGSKLYYSVVCAMCLGWCCYRTCYWTILLSRCRNQTSLPVSVSVLLIMYMGIYFVFIFQLMNIVLVPSRGEPRASQLVITCGTYTLVVAATAGCMYMYLYNVQCVLG